MISKKDLLKEMNISYGQLYRWKREGLIPGEWFNKQSVSTGQETFFERNLIIPRIKKIIELKDKYQLDELKEFFESNTDKKKYTLREVIILNSIDPFILKQYSLNHDSFTVLELAILSIFSKYQKMINFNDYLGIDFSIDFGEYFYILNSDKYYIMIGQKEMLIDNRITIIEKIKIEDIVSSIACELKD